MPSLGDHEATCSCLASPTLSVSCPPYSGSLRRRLGDLPQKYHREYLVVYIISHFAYPTIDTEGRAIQDRIGAWSVLVWTSFLPIRKHIFFRQDFDMCGVFEMRASRGKR